MRIEADKAQAIEVFLGEFSQPGQGVLHRQHQRQLITGVGHHLQQFIEFRWQFTTDDRQVDLTVGHTPARAAGAVDLELHGDVWIFLAEQADHPGHQIGAGGLTCPHDQGSTFEVVEIIQGPTGFVALAQDPVAVTQQQMARFSELRLAPAAIKQRHLQLLLQVLDLKADGGLGDVKTVGGFLEAALTDNRAKDPQLVEGERQIGHRGTPGGTPEI